MDADGHRVLRGRLTDRLTRAVLRGAAGLSQLEVHGDLHVSSVPDAGSKSNR